MVFDFLNAESARNCPLLFIHLKHSQRALEPGLSDLFTGFIGFSASFHHRSSYVGTGVSEKKLKD